ncbi:hypothetical protein MTP99_005979 [Tenebrio molitor]|nr:hypothetical protein MTP99_005979 [Tenebrio molitor]
MGVCGRCGICLRENGAVSSKTQCTGSNRSILNYSQTTLHNIKEQIQDICDKRQDGVRRYIYGRLLRSSISDRTCAASSFRSV